MKNQVKSENHKQYTVAIIGGGIAGATIALRLAELNIKVILLEKGKSLVNGPPICHLHAGGNLYREINDEQCITLLKESIDLIKLYPNTIDYRPTLIAIPNIDKGNTVDLLPRLEKLKAEYQKLIHTDKENKVLGEPENYYKLYDRTEVETLAKIEIHNSPKNLDEWMIYAAKTLDLDKLKFPLLMVEEYGLNIFRLAATANISLENNINCKLTKEANILDIKPSNIDSCNWDIEYEHKGETKNVSASFLVNACGFRTGNIDNMLSIKRNRMVEFKAAYISKWESFQGFLPEIIFHGTRGTKNGMGQLTPYAQGYFQIHGMTPEITLFEDGLVASNKENSQPILNNNFIAKIDDKWDLEEIKLRTKKSIEHITQYIPDFKDAVLGGIPLFGAQQIPGEDPDLRAANISFSMPNYACCETVKASSTISAANAIIDKLIENKQIENKDYKENYFPITNKITEQEIQARAELLCKQRNYPIALASVVTKKNHF